MIRVFIFLCWCYRALRGMPSGWYASQLVAHHLPREWLQERWTIRPRPRHHLCVGRWGTLEGFPQHMTTEIRCFQTINIVPRSRLLHTRSSSTHEVDHSSRICRRGLKRRESGIYTERQNQDPEVAGAESTGLQTERYNPYEDDEEIARLDGSELNTDEPEAKPERENGSDAVTDPDLESPTLRPIHNSNTSESRYRDAKGLLRKATESTR
jgi:hypothetical protein